MRHLRLVYSAPEERVTRRSKRRVHPTTARCFRCPAIKPGEEIARNDGACDACAAYLDTFPYSSAIRDQKKEEGMLSGFDKAVGPLQPQEHIDASPYGCQIALDEARAERTQFNPSCMFQLFDGGPGKTYVRCAAHDYTFIAIDWTAPHFAGGATLPESIDALRALYGSAAEMGVPGVDGTVPSVQQQRMGEVFTSIVKNTTALVGFVSLLEDEP